MAAAAEIRNKEILYNKMQETKSFVLVSTNPIYEPYELPVSEIMEIWKFTNFISSELPDSNVSKDDLTTSVMNLQREISLLRNEIKKPGN